MTRMHAPSTPKRPDPPFGVIRHNAPDVPPDAPAPLRGETPWFSGTQVPVQIGVYKRLSLSGLVMFSFFDGDMWLWNHRDATRAAQAKPGEASLIQALPWCGLELPPPQGYGPILGPDVDTDAGGAA